MSTTTLRPLSVGEILDGAFALYRRHFVTFLLTSAIFFTPIFLLELARVPFLVSAYSSNVLAMAAGMAATWQMSEAALGRKPDAKGGIRRCFEWFLPTLGALIAMGFLVGIGTLFFVIPGILLGIRYFATMQTSILEKSAHPLKRSAALAADSGGKIFVVWLLTVILSWIPAIALGTITISLREAPAEPSLVKQLLTTTIAVVAVPFTNGVMTLLYYDQRVRKEGLDVKLAAADIGDALAAVRSPAPPQAAK